MLHNPMYPFMSHISLDQAGFTRNRWTISNLVIFTQCLLTALDELFGCYFSKAFNKIYHYTLLNKLSMLSSDMFSIRFIDSYLRYKKPGF